MRPHKPHKVREMEIEVRLYVTRGFGWAMADAMKELAPRILEEGRGAIQPVIVESPHIIEEYPHDGEGWLRFEYVVRFPIQVDITRLLEDRAGCMGFLAKRIYNSRDVSYMLGREIKRAIESKMHQKDWLGVSSSIEDVNVRMGPKRYV